METTAFKKIVADILLAKGFTMKGSNFWLIKEELIMAIGLQRSSFSKSYYINIGYIIPILHPELSIPRYFDGDVRARFSFEREGKDTSLFDLDVFKETDKDRLVDNINENIERYVDPVDNLEQLKQLIMEKPVMLLQTFVGAKKLLGFL